MPFLLRTVLLRPGCKLTAPLLAKALKVCFDISGTVAGFDINSFLIYGRYDPIVILKINLKGKLNWRYYLRVWGLERKLLCFNYLVKTEKTY